MFKKGSKTNKRLLTVASVAYLINIFISVLDYSRFSNETSIVLIAVSTVALLLVFLQHRKAKDKK